MLDQLTPMLTEVAAPVISFAMGALLLYLFGQRRVNDREDTIEELETDIEVKEKKIKSLNKSVKDHDSTIEGLNAELAQRDENIGTLNTQLNDRESNIKGLEGEMDSLDERMKQAITERDERIGDLEDTVESRDSEIRGLNATLEERDGTIEDLNTQLQQRQTTISGLEYQITEKDEEINAQNDDIIELNNQHQETKRRAEAAEEQTVKLEGVIQERDEEIAANKARLRTMQDDFTHLDGIGPKVATVLRLSGIKTFKKLASTDTDRLLEILEKENPSLLRLTDPSTWAEQAKMASLEEWEALKALQDILRENRKQERALPHQTPEAEEPVVIEQV